MVGARTVTGSKLLASLRHQLMGRPVSRRQAFAARMETDEVAEITRTDVRAPHQEMDSRQQYLDQYRELTATPARWLRLS